MEQSRIVLSGTDIVGSGVKQTSLAGTRLGREAWKSQTENDPLIARHRFAQRQLEIINARVVPDWMLMPPIGLNGRCL